MVSESPKVFISYRHESTEHKARVLAFASRLVKEGLDVAIDLWVPNPPGGFARWAQQELTQAKFVLLICTDVYRSYVENVNYKEGAGVIWEISLVRNFLFDAKGLDNRFIPVYYGESGFDSIPLILRTAPSYRIDTPEGYLDLYRLLTDQPLWDKPDMGNIVVLPRFNPTTVQGQTATTPAQNEATLLEESTFTTLISLPVGVESNHKSLNDTTKTYIRFDNYLSTPVNIYWLDYRGQRMTYGELEAGGSRLQQTWLTHPWVVTAKDATGQEIVIGLFECVENGGIASLLTIPPPPSPNV
jgi:hypothetical protein